MSLDPESQSQARELFFQEALELLEQIQQDLSTLQRGSNLSRLDSLVRAVGGLKSGADRLNLSDIYFLARRFENVLRSMEQTPADIDTMILEQLWHAHRCLHLTLLTQLSTNKHDLRDVLAQAESVLSYLENRLNPQSQIEEFLAIAEPEVETIEVLFDRDVVQAINRLEAALLSPTSVQIGEIAMQIEVLLSLGEVLEISEFVAIATVALTSLQTNPQIAHTIGQMALTGFRAAREKVLGGDLSALPPSELQHSEPFMLSPESLLEQEREDSLFVVLEESLNNEPINSVDSIGESQIDNSNRLSVSEELEGQIAGSATLELRLKTTKLFVWQADFMVFTLAYDNIEEYLIPKIDRIVKSEGQRFLSWREQVLPIYPLFELLSANDSFLPSNRDRVANVSSLDESTSPMLVIKLDAQLFALEIAIERLVTEPEIVIKNFDATLAPSSYFFGCTTLSGNRLLPVIDVSVLLAEQIGQHQNHLDLTTLSDSLNAAIAYKIGASQAAILEESSELPTILVVEDSLTWRQYLVFTLHKAGYRALQAQDGQEGFKQLQQNPTVRLVICDLEMPNLNGFGFLICCRQDPQLAKIPAIVLSNYSSEQHRQLAMQLGANAYFTKPYDEPEFLAAIASLIKQTKVN
ncbi:MAG: response regulator [Hydrococcus sp. Prado102]|jgi:chemotaxis protein histidine kinase CheA/ActR/RegA family two-component response regulator|nr:response regulator [Hydrococcus sp. Prado102]